MLHMWYECHFVELQFICIRSRNKIYLLLWITVKIIALAQTGQFCLKASAWVLFPRYSFGKSSYHWLNYNLSEIPALPNVQKESPVQPIFLSAVTLFYSQPSHYLILFYLFVNIFILCNFPLSPSQAHTGNVISMRAEIAYGKCFRQLFWHL